MERYEFMFKTQQLLSSAGTNVQWRIRNGPRHGDHFQMTDAPMPMRIDKSKVGSDYRLRVEVNMSNDADGEIAFLLEQLPHAVDGGDHVAFFADSPSIMANCIERALETLSK